MSSALEETGELGENIMKGNSMDKKLHWEQLNCMEINSIDKNKQTNKQKSHPSKLTQSDTKARHTLIARRTPSLALCVYWINDSLGASVSKVYMNGLASESVVSAPDGAKQTTLKRMDISSSCNLVVSIFEFEYVSLV